MTMKECRQNTISSLINLLQKEGKADYIYSESNNKYQLFLADDKAEAHVQVFDKRVSFKELMTKLLESY